MTGSVSTIRYPLPLSLPLPLWQEPPLSATKPRSQVPANLTVYDIAGLTRGASTGAGLGNAFLSHIRAVDAIFQVVRCFDDAEIIHVEGDVDPVRDLQIINDELRIKDIEFVEKNLEALKKQTSRGGQSLEMKKLKEEQAIVESVLSWLVDEQKDVRKKSWGNKEVGVCCFSFFWIRYHFPCTLPWNDDKEYLYSNTNPSSSNGLANYNA